MRSPRKYVKPILQKHPRTNRHFFCREAVVGVSSPRGFICQTINFYEVPICIRNGENLSQSSISGTIGVVRLRRDRYKHQFSSTPQQRDNAITTICTKRKAALSPFSIKRQRLFGIFVRVCGVLSVVTSLRWTNFCLTGIAGIRLDGRGCHIFCGVASCLPMNFQYGIELV